MNNLVPTIGIEMHAEMKSQTKVFSSAQNVYTKDANNHVTEVDLGLPGILPVVNKECVRKSIMMALILGCDIPSYLYFDRKNYYYPDLPKGYQITQSHAPIGINGKINIPYQKGLLEVKIHDIHLEEDTAKLEHLDHETLINYNRAGVPLLELVTEPVFHSKEEVIAFIEYIRRIYQYTDISDADIKKGQIRCDINISIASENAPLGTKVEIKGVNSLSNIEKAIDKEIERQLNLYEQGKQDEILQETRRYDESKDESIRMRSKEDAIDYKYFVEPNIPKIKIAEDWIAEIKKDIPELPLNRIERYQKLGLKEEDIEILVKERKISDYFDQCINKGSDPILTSNWVITNIMSYLNKNNIKIDEINCTPDDLTALITKIKDQTISHKQAKEILDKVLLTNASIKELLSENKQISDSAYLEELVEKIIRENESQVASYKNGRTNVFQFFVGCVMKETKGKANPVLTKELIEKKLNE